MKPFAEDTKVYRGMSTIDQVQCRSIRDVGRNYVNVFLFFFVCFFVVFFFFFFVVFNLNKKYLQKDNCRS